MELKINNQTKFFSENTITVQQLLDMEMPDKQKGIAVAIAERVVPKTNWATTVLSNKDEVLIIKATQGG